MQGVADYASYMKLYTKRGDAGKTDLFGGQRVSKDHLRVEAYGTVDELNATVGLCLSLTAVPGEIAEPLRTIQSRLFEIGADLATPRDPADMDKGGMVPRVQPEQVAELEGWIDALCDPLPAMKTFILPGGTELSARLHLCRTVCRRAERLTIALSHVEPVGDAVIVYLNRLSDLLFAMSRFANHAAGVADVPWVSPRQKRLAVFEDGAAS